MCHYVLGCTCFPFGCIEYGTKGPIGGRKKGNWTFPFLKTEKWSTSLQCVHVNFKVQCMLSFSGFCSRMISFCEQLCPAWGVKFWIPMCCVTWSEQFFRRDKRVCCMISKWISSIGLLIMSEMTENPTAKYNCMLNFCFVRPCWY